MKVKDTQKQLCVAGIIFILPFLASHSLDIYMDEFQNLYFKILTQESKMAAKRTALRERVWVREGEKGECMDVWGMCVGVRDSYIL